MVRPSPICEDFFQFATESQLKCMSDWAYTQIILRQGGDRRRIVGHTVSPLRGKHEISYQCGSST